MTSDDLNRQQRLMELLADRATEGLGEHDSNELSQLQEALHAVDDESFDHIAAMTARVWHAQSGAEAVPVASVQRLRAAGAAWAAGMSGTAAVGEIRVQDVLPGGALPERHNTRRLPVMGYAGWLAAAAIAIAWWAVPSANTSSNGDGRAISAKELSSLRAAADLVESPWAAGTDVAGRGVTGKVLWSPALQRGCMVFNGLRPNDPSVEAYQLWIFDSTRDERFPVHGGVFDVAAGKTEVVVPISAKLPIEKIAAFVVTVEKPGGVWVSDRSRIASIAQVR